MSVPLQTDAVMPEDSSLESLGALLSVQKSKRHPVLRNKKIDVLRVSFVGKIRLVSIIFF